jgi:hypothetical protein
MRLRHLVPTLGLVATAISAQAVETAPGLTIGGFVDSIMGVVTNPGYDSDNDASIDFTAMAELNVGYAISPEVEVRLDVEFYSDQLDLDDDGNLDSNVNLEQAYVAWGINDQVTLTAGRWNGLIGYEAWDAPGLYRVNTSPVFDLNGVNPTGINVNFKANEQLSVDAYIVDGAFVEEQQTSDGLGYGVSATYKAETFLFDLDIATDPEGITVDDGILGVNVSGEYSGVEKLIAFGDIAYRDAGDLGTIMGVMVGGNYTINEKMSATLMISYIDDDDDADLSGIGPVEEMEVAVALLTKPTNSDNFGLNVELSYTSPEDSDADEEIGFFVELLGIIP